MTISLATPAYAASEVVNNGSFTNYEGGTIENEGSFENKGLFSNKGVFENGGEILGAGVVQWFREIVSKAGALNNTLMPSGTCGEATSWMVTNDGILIISGTGAVKDYSTDAENDTRPWALYRDIIKGVVVEDGVTSIGSGVFAYMPNLETAEIAGSVKSIDTAAFAGRNDLPDISYAGSFADWQSIIASNEALAAVEQEKEFKNIAEGTCGENMTWVLDNDNVLTISGEGAMMDYKPELVLKAVEEVRELRSESNNVEKQQEGTIVSEEIVKGETDGLVRAPWKDFNDYISDVVIEEGVTYIGANAFSYCPYIKSVSIPNTVEEIGSYAISGCSLLTSVDLPRSITALGNGIFADCYNLESIHFDGTKLNWLKMTENNYIAPSNCQIEWRVMDEGKTGENVQYIIDNDGVMTLSGTGRTETLDPSGNNGLIASWTSVRSEIKSLIIEEGITGFGDYWMYYMPNLTYIRIPASMTDLNPTSNINYCNSAMPNLASIEIDENNPNYTASNGVVYNKDKTNIVSYLASKTDESFTILSTVTGFTPSAFNGVTALKEIRFEGTRAEWDKISNLANAGLAQDVQVSYTAIAKGTAGDDVVWTLSSDGTLNVSATGEGNGHMDDYTTPDNKLNAVMPWAEYADEILAINIDETVTHIGEGAFKGLAKAETVTFGGGATIGNYAFSRCTNLKDFNLPNSENLTIGQGAFEFCKTIENLNIPEKTRAVGEGAFANCSVLNNVTIAGNSTHLGNSLLMNCASLETATVPTVTEYMFSECASLKSVSVTRDGASIGAFAFQNCRNLTKVNLNSTLSAVGENVFNGIQTAITIVFDGSLTQWDAVEGSAMLKANQNVTVVTNLVAEGKLTDTIAWAIDNNGTLKLNGQGTTPDFYTLTYNEGETETVARVEAVTAPWEAYSNRIVSVVVEDGITAIGSGLFATGTGVESVLYPNLGTVTIADSVKSIGDAAFYNCHSLKSVAGLEGLERIGSLAFFGCVNLSALEFPESLETIGNSAFEDCGSLQTIAYGGTRATWDNLTANVVTGIHDMVAVTCRAIAEGACGETAEFAIANDGSMSINGTGVVTSSDGWADYAEEVTRLTVAEGIKDISGLSLVGMTKLAQLSLPSSLEVLNEANTLCNADNSLETLMSLTVGSLNKKYRVYNDALYDTGLTKLYYVVNVPERAPNDGSTISGLRVPNTVREVTPNAFKWATNVLKVDFTGSKAQWDAIAGLSASGLSTAIEVTCATRDFGFFGENDSMSWILTMEGVLAIGGNRDIPDFYLNINTEYEDELPVDNSDRQTAPWLAYADDIRSVKVNEGITGIGDAAFSGCSNLSAVSLPSSLRAIGIAAFYQNTSLRTVTVPAATEEIGAYAFAECANLKSVTINGAAVDLGKYMFRNCVQLTEVAFADNATVETIPAGFLYGCTGLETFTVPDGTNAIARSALANNKKLQTVTIPASVESIDKTAFSGSTVNTIYFGGTSAAWQSLDEAADTIAGLANTNIVCQGDEATTVVASGFCGNDSELGKSVAWSLDSNGTLSISADESASTMCKMADYSANVPAPWSDYLATLETVLIAEEVTNIGSYAFANATKLKSVVFANENSSLQSIGEHAFDGCTALQTILIPEGVTDIGNYAFSGCTGLTEVTLPNTVNTVGEYSFADCTALAKVEGDYNPTSIKQSSFLNCSLLENFWLGSALSSLGTKAFFASGLKRVTIPGNVTDIWNETFRNCTELESVILENGVKNIHPNAFSGCSKLAIVSLPSTIQSIAVEALPNSVRTITFDGSRDDWAEIQNNCIIPEGAEMIFAPPKE